NDFAPFVLAVVTSETVSRSHGRRMLPFVVGAASLGIMASAELFGPYTTSFPWLIGITISWFGGLFVQTLDRKQTELRQAQAGLAEKVALDERERIAREIHAVVAHSMSVTMLHITAARLALERNRNDDALEALLEAE